MSMCIYVKFSLCKKICEGFVCLSITLLAVWDECNCAVVWAFFGIAFLWDWKLTFSSPVENTHTVKQTKMLRFSPTWIIHTENCSYIHSHVPIHILIHIWMPSHSHIYKYTQINTDFNKMTHTYMFIHIYPNLHIHKVSLFIYWHAQTHKTFTNFFTQRKFHINAHAHIQ